MSDNFFYFKRVEIVSMIFKLLRIFLAEYNKNPITNRTIKEIVTLCNLYSFLDMTLQKHEIWDFFPTAISFDSFQSNLLKPIFLKPNVSEDIKLQVSVIEKLLIHSYYEYDFIDLALNQSIIILEKAMRIRYREININLLRN